MQYRKLRDGTVVYRSADEDKVKRVRDQDLEASYTPSYRFEDPVMQARFIEALRSEGVAFAVESRDGKYWVTWSKIDDKKARRIREEILDKAMSSK